ncbi:SDR family oxidoreductase [Planococcus sp. ISL-110]|uniref:SDR family oxidoreductase n=1 Tax=Planococcus sp. ISL-110 TaxID=2819167 RepID=UPI001BE8305F|nr:SDR family oxidoreductase [Planococcus sp. ISL-110]MBT2569686.1 SDR family oxidoreductase [Planococcus sp. ISL-110]
MKVAIIGANGKVGSKLGRILADRGDEPIGFIRNAKQAEQLEAKGIRTVIADLVETSVEEFSRLLKACDAVVFTAGAGGAGDELTSAIDGQGLVKIAEAADLAEVRRFLLVSAFPDAGRSKETVASFEHYMQVKRQSEVDLVKTALDWTILRPGTLTDQAGTGKVNLGYTLMYDTISREDVAAVLAELLNYPETAGQILEVVQGEEPIGLAVRAKAGK